MTAQLNLVQSTASTDPTDTAQQVAIYIATLQHVMRQLPQISSFVEDSASNIISEFRKMAAINSTQAESIERVLDLSRFIKVDEELLPFDRCIDELYRPMSDAIMNILSVSKLAMSMVLAISKAADNIKRVEKYIDEIQDITKQTNMLAMNTQIEAARAGEAGKSFQFIAGEVKHLSQDIKKLSQQMQGDISQVAESVKESFSVIDQLANYDMTENMRQKERIDAVMKAISAQNHNFTQLLEQAARMNRENAGNISNMVMNIQFQDRTTQVVGDMVGMLKIIHRFVSEHMPSNASQLNDAQSNAIMNELIADIKLTDVRRQLVAALYELGVLAYGSEAVQNFMVSDEHATQTAALDRTEGDIELF